MSSIVDPSRNIIKILSFTRCVHVALTQDHQSPFLRISHTSYTITVRISGFTVFVVSYPYPTNTIIYQSRGNSNSDPMIGLRDICSNRCPLVSCINPAKLPSLRLSVYYPRTSVASDSPATSPRHSHEGSGTNYLECTIVTSLWCPLQLESV